MTLRNAGLILHRRGQTEKLFDNTEGDKHLSHHQMLFVCCDVHLAALWWRPEESQDDVHSALLLFNAQLLSIIHACTVTLHFSLFSPIFPACLTSLMKHLLPLFPPYNLADIIHTLSCFLPSHLGDLLLVRRQEAVCGYAGKTADRH